VYDYTVYPVP